jgi:aryl-alcohol dehydrogenase-like predicted oxidoreductase
MNTTTNMEYRLLGRSGFKVPVLGFGAGTFGGEGPLFSAWGNTDVAGARRIVDICLEAGLNFFDSADIYSEGVAEEVLGAAIKGRRDQVLISTKATFRSGDGPNDVGSSRWYLVRAVEGSLRRLGTDYIDLFQLHGFDALTPIEEVVETLTELVRAGKIRYLGCSNFSGWHLMKSLAVSEKYGLERYVAHQAYYSLIGRDFEWELMPLAVDQKVGTVVWSPLGWGRLTGKIRRGQPRPETSRLNVQQTVDAGPPVDDNYVYDVVDALDAVAAETGKTVPQISLNWLLQRPSVSTIIIGARNEEQLRWTGAVRPERGADRRLDAAQRKNASLSLLASRRPRTQSLPNLMTRLLSPTLPAVRKRCQFSSQHLPTSKLVGVLRVERFPSAARSRSFRSVAMRGRDLFALAWQGRQSLYLLVNVRAVASHNRAVLAVREGKDYRYQTRAHRPMLSLMP